MQLLKSLFTYIKPEETELQRKRRELADQLDSVSFTERCRILDNLMHTDGELYASWIQDPY